MREVGVVEEVRTCTGTNRCEAQRASEGEASRERSLGESNVPC